MFLKISFLSSLGGDGAAGAVVRSLADAAVDLLRALRHRREVHLLADLDDRALKDIGLLRSDVEGALLEPFHKDPSKVLGVRRVEHAGRDRSLAVTEGKFAPRHACCV